MAALDDYLEAALKAAQKEFPEIGFMFVSVEDKEPVEDGPEITFMTNMAREEVSDTLDCLLGPESVPEGASLH